MKTMLWKIAKRIMWRLTFLFPVKPKKIFAVSFYGRGYSDNPSAIFEQLHAQDESIELYWAVKNSKDDITLPDYVKKVEYETLQYIYHMTTSRVWIDNCRKWSYVRKKNNQYYIQTYHALPFKKIEADVEDVLDKGYIKAGKNDSKMANIMISGSAFMTNLYKKSFWYNGKVFECGTPRNDILVNVKEREFIKIKKRLNINLKNRKILLYAPTFRANGDLSAYNINYEKLKRSLEEKFGGDWLVGVKLHPNISHKSKELGLNHDYIVDLSEYPDMQELLAIADALIVDYSSSIFDYIITKKPCFMYAPDLDEYRKDRDLYFTLGELPFSVAYNNAQLVECIKKYDIKSSHHDIDNFMQKYGYNEKGHAAEQVAELILRKLRN